MGNNLWGCGASRFITSYFQKPCLQTSLHQVEPSNRPNICGGKPCIRGMRIRVTDVLALLANHLSFDQIIEEMPDLEMADIQACIEYAIRKIDYPILRAA